MLYNLAANAGNQVKLAVNAGNQVKIASLEGIETILQAMKGHSGVAAVQEHGCGALRNLASGNDNSKVKIASLALK